MGRLFWKFFFVFWLAQVVTSSCTGLTLWLAHRAADASPPAFRNETGTETETLRPPPFPPPGLKHPSRQPPLPFGGASHGRLPIPLLPILLGSIVSLLFAALLAWYFSRPIRSLSAAFEAVSGGKLDTRVDAAIRKRNDELGDLGADFDRMTERLQLLIEAQRRLMHDVSHEMRAPLARLQAVVDLIRQQPERTVEFIERIERNTVRMDMLVGELLTLARHDAGMHGGLDDEIDLAEIILDIVHDAEVELAAKGCSIVTELAEAFPVRGNRELLRRAFENVVRNAVQYTAGNTQIKVTVQSGSGQNRLRISVRDHGPGVLQTDLAAIFDPFFRSGSGKTSGYGLGLALTRRIVTAHGGNVCAANAPDGGLVVTLELPRAS